MHAFPSTTAARVRSLAVPQLAADLRVSLLVLLVTLCLPYVAHGASVTGSYREEGTRKAYDSFSIEFDAASQGSISGLVLDLSGSSGAVFDPADFDFEVAGGDDVGFDITLGFDLQAADVLQLSFSDFDPGETFAFRVDVDDPKGRTTRGDDLAGATLAVSLVGGGSAADVWVRDPSDSKQATAQVLVPNPEPSSALLLGLGIAGLGVWRRRRR